MTLAMTSSIAKSGLSDEGAHDLPAGPAIDINRLFRDHHQRLIRFVQRYARNSEDAEDIVQNTFMEALRCADRFSGLSKPSTWLFGIALNLARNQVRRNCADMIDSVEEDFIDQVADQHANPSNLIEARELSAKVDILLRGMPARIRDTFDAVVSGDASYEEAAEYLHIPIGTVRSRVSRVRAAVRREFGNAIAAS